MSPNPFFNAHHSPIGAFATLTLGQPGAKGGFGLERGYPADEDVLVVLQDLDGEGYRALPFFAGSENTDASRYDVEGLSAADRQNLPIIHPFSRDQISRTFGLCHDTWRAGDLTFTLHTQVCPVPDPTTASDEALRAALVPAIWAEITIDNREGKKTRKGFFGFSGKDPYTFMRTWEADDFVAAGQGPHLGLFARNESGVSPGQGFSAAHILAPRHPRNARFGIGGTGGLVLEVAAGERRSFMVAVAFFRGGDATTGMATRYFYTKLFADLDAVGRYALSRAAAVAEASDGVWPQLEKLNPDRRFMLCHAVRSYYGSTELLVAEDGTPFWVVNEGEYRMMNTFDLTVDHLFFELKQNPWVVRNQLEWFHRRYSYTDEVVDPKTKQRYPGGLSFTHDMGIANAMTPPGYSSYELFGLDGCFSHMTHEQLVNFIHCATLYVHHTRDHAWAKSIAPVLADCQASLLVRDHPDPASRNGIMGFDSSRCDGGGEITTYDSLDASLGQARNNLYLAVKTWAAYLALESFWSTQDDTARAAEATAQARLGARTLVASGEGRATLPAVLFENVDSSIIPAIEGLVFPWLLGRKDVFEPSSPYASLLAALKRHTAHVLAPENKLCRFEDGGWKISSTSNNSWLSKVYLCQFVARHVLGHGNDADEAVADAAHHNWLLRPENTYYAWSDQMVSGVAQGSKYYPRGVTAVLWIS